MQAATKPVHCGRNAATLQPHYLQVTAHEIDQMVQAMDRAGTGKIHYQVLGLPIP